MVGVGHTWEAPSMDQCQSRGKLLTNFPPLSAIGPYKFPWKRGKGAIGPYEVPWNSYGPMAPKSLWKFWSTPASVHRVLFSAYTRTSGAHMQNLAWNCGENFRVPFVFLPSKHLLSAFYNTPPPRTRVKWVPFVLLAFFPLFYSNWPFSLWNVVLWELEKAIFGPEKDKWWIRGSKTPKPLEMPIKLGKTSQHHNWPRYMDWRQFGPKIAIKQGEKRQKDKWYLFRAPTPPPFENPSKNPCPYLKPLRGAF